MDENTANGGQSDEEEIVSIEIEGESKFLPFFLSLIEKLSNIYDEMIEICQTAKHNKESCELILNRVGKADMSLSNLKTYRKGNLEYFSEENYNNLHKLVTIIETPFSNFLPCDKNLKFLPLIREVTKIYDEISEIHQSAQYNKKTCLLMLKKVEIAVTALNNLRIHSKENFRYLSRENYINLCSLITIIGKICKLLTEISRFESYQKFIQIEKNIEIFRGLNNDFNSTVRLLDFSLIISPTDSLVCTGTESASKIEVPFASFLSLIEEMNKLYNDIVEIHENAQYNKNTCETMLERVRIAITAIGNLKIRNLEFFSKKNFNNFHNLVAVISEMRHFLADISQGSKKYVQAKDINEKFINLIDEFETAIRLLQFHLIIYFAARDNDDENERIRADIEEEWIKKKIEDADILYFEYSEFIGIEEIGKGGFGIVNKAETSDKKLVALKGLIEKKNSKFEENIIKSFVEELKLLRTISYHDNINSFLGITKDYAENYIMVLEYANNGNLRDYLKGKFDSLRWENKIQMALDITCGLKCLHSKNIIHRDLHSKNILVSDGKLLIADFGLSKQITEATSNSKANSIGIIEYVEPQCLKSVRNAHSFYKKDQRSDIYSLGVLLWEITSGRPPFHNTEERDWLGYHIYHSDLRENPIEDTPLEYSRLYQKCWDGDPEKRPDIDQVYDDIFSQFNEEFIKRRMKEEKIRYFEYSEFNNIKIIGDGVVNKAEAYDKNQVALKCFIQKKSPAFKEKFIENLVKQLKLLYTVSRHEYINSFFGISNDNISYFMVFEYANDGNLRDYLKEKLNILQWENKIRMALDITCGLKHLHSMNIIHRNLHSKNILVNNGRLLIADTEAIPKFGIPKIKDEKKHKLTDNRIEIIGYIDPQCLKDINYKRDKKSDIYSLSVLLWEITSGRPPFSNISQKEGSLRDDIGHKNLREKPVDGTPLEYQQLYEKCWDIDPGKRPDVDQVYNEILSQFNEELIERKMKKEDVRYFEYSEFNKVEKIEGGHGVVNKAETNKKQVALKYLVGTKISKFEEKAIENLAKQLKYFCTVSCHYNINNFLGISKDDIAYVVVLEYTNNGNLRDFLKENFGSLQWENKIRMALDITRGLKYLHSKNIIHKNLHSNNILVDDDKLLIADFGLLRPATSNSKGNIIGNIGYIDSQCCKDICHKSDKKSDIYSLGVLLWEITSGHPPFYNISQKGDSLYDDIGHKNLREKPIDGTPLEYQQLYEKCWDGDPGKRPNANQVYNEILSQANTEDTHEKHEDSLVTSNSNNFNDLEYQQLFEKCWDDVPGKRPDDIHEKHEDSLVISNRNNFNDLHKQSGQPDLCIENKETSNSLCIESDFMLSKNQNQIMFN
ncbi:kinase-like domain-containing protein [Rhizophagus irregularis DAOM 181602=DAOM 197198]|nr:kinase-like domain-containing protein [Rhizophagus irregularis DAOM 181602=DAOM 197198]